MTTVKMNVHQALARLKVLPSRISDSIYGAKFVIANKHSNKKVGGKDIAVVNSEIKSDYQSINDLLKEFDATKRAVNLSNSVTDVTIPGIGTFKMAEVIAMKDQCVEKKQMLLNAMKRAYTEAVNTCDKQNGDILETKCKEYLSSLGYAQSKDGVKSDEVLKLEENFKNGQKFELVDPIGIKAEIDKLQKELDTFVAEVDAAISTSNATTELTIEF